MTDPGHTLSQTHRDHLATYVGEGGIGASWWYHAGIGVASGLVVSSGDIETRWIAITVALAGAAAIGILSRVWIERAGVVPRLRGMPWALKRVLIAYWTVFGVVMGGMLTWAFLAQGEWVFTRAGVVQVIVVALGGPITDRAYRRSARGLAQRSGIDRG